MKIIYLFLGILIITAACSGGGGNSVPVVSDFATGHEGLEFEFSRGRPPEQLYAGDAVPVAISIHNKGATKINYEKPAVISISYDDYYIDFSGVTSGKPNIAYSPRIYGKSVEFPRGETTQDISLGLLAARTLQGQVESPDTEIFVNICYPYNTTYHTITCVNSDFYLSDERQEICQSEIDSDSAGQGAPIAVTTITPRITLVRDFNQEMPIGLDGALVTTAVQEVKPLFEIEIQNKNDGIPYVPSDDDTKEFCELKNLDRKTHINKVHARVTLDASEEHAGTLDCNHMDPNKNDVVLTLIDGKGTIYCELPNDNTIIASYNYFAQLSVYLDYVYSEGESLNLEIVRKQFE